MTYNKIIEELIQENEQLKQSKSEAFKWAYSLEKEEKETFKELEKLQKVYNKVVDEKIELQDYLLCAEAMEDYWKIHSSEINDENAKLNAQIKLLQQDLAEDTYFNEWQDSKKQVLKLKEDYKQKIEDMKSLTEELYNSSNKIIELQMQLYDAQVMKNRLTKILNETTDYTL